ncbi:WD40/YVTN repeat-like-containing domain [Lasallia pustulata]|uniref:WD40/YVTN repeat-like-containing domain n=1 Tax=Lasallia pustulata TaxID=136370 RepID=A0A1W5D915_9LECA|nr:WD40/YVTN repeat-like-containing domain [Lasallia pustulata]
MKTTLQDRLLRRELGGLTRYSAIKGLYGDKTWIDDLDIVNELGGHSGCVNALSWSKSGRLLASGSDDTHLNIHTYQPESSTTPFALTTAVSTGHTANIFSVKFMPHSADRTLVTCAGDAEVRVFDIEYAGRSTIPSASSGRRLGRNQMYNGVRYLSDGDTNARVYRSHGDRVKRIVTESSPHLFLTCSEDGEVRQWDLRLPSSAYPAPRGGHSFLRYGEQYARTNIPPPLISYKRYNLDLNSISCSGSQPHYIALGGAHLHCFLHDRRMLGRDIMEEQGRLSSTSSAGSMSEREDELMGEATRCVRRFAPNGKKTMERSDSGHITACKISDANPNEMIVSWSGEQIYSFDLVRSPDAKGGEEKRAIPIHKGKGSGRVQESKERKRKRHNGRSSTSAEDARRGNSKVRRDESRLNGEGEMALRVRYENGQSEDISIDVPAADVPKSDMDQSGEDVLSETQKKSSRLARVVVKIRSLMFSLAQPASPPVDQGAFDYSARSALFTTVLGFAAATLPEMDHIMRHWRYPVPPTEVDVVFQQTLRGNRDSSRRFVQAAGTLARVLGGKLQTTGGQSSLLHYFEQIGPGSQERSVQASPETFSYDFLKAILLWLEYGPQALLQGFQKPSNVRSNNSRFPIPTEAGLSAIDTHLIPYLLRSATGRAVCDVDASRFERDEYRKIFDTETAAVIAFSTAIRIPLEDLSRALMPASSSADGAPTAAANVTAQDKKAAMKFWGFKVGRGLLMNAGEGVNFAFVDRAFGGLGTAKVHDEGRSQENIDPEEAEEVVDSVTLVRQQESPRPGSAGGEDRMDIDTNGLSVDNVASPSSHQGTTQAEGMNSDEEVILMGDLHDEIADRLVEHDEQGGHSDLDDAAEDDESDKDGDEDSDDGEITSEERQFMWQSALERRKLREQVQADVPCSPHTRQYRGHCNVKTVKDINFFGLQDEYVVSGSDSGHLFIWDKKTTQLVNILEGDVEVVNVVQGHPYEPLLAVSGIDHTIKIFSPDARAQDDARAGINLGISSTGSSGYSSLEGFIGRHRRRESADGAVGLASRKRMQQSYQICAQNDADRRGGMRDAFITRDMLAQLAAQLRERQMGGGGRAGEGEGEGAAIVIDDNCEVRLYTAI